MTSVILGIIIGIAFSAFMPSVPNALRHLLKWDKNDKNKKEDDDKKQ